MYNGNGKPIAGAGSRYKGIFMRRTTAALFFILLLSGSVFVSGSSATGFGVYGLLGSGRTEFHEDTDYAGWGFVYDTAVAKKNVFNYRLNFGYERLRVDSAFGKESFSGYVLDSDFGLGIVRNDSVRLWLGPEVRIAKLDTEWGFGLGPVAGLNLHAGEIVTIIIKAGYRWMSYSDLIYSSMDESHGFVSIGLMFRLRGDRYRPR